jgi:acyl transferase domain-containing protein
MGRDVAVNSPVARRLFADMDDLRSERGLGPLSRVIFPPPAFDAAGRTAQADLLRRTEHAQPALGVVNGAYLSLLHQMGFRPDFAAGHSFGELSALWAAGVFADDAYLRLAHVRGELMAPRADVDAVLRPASRRTRSKPIAAISATRGNPGAPC